MKTAALMALLGCSMLPAAQAPPADPNARTTAVIRGRILTGNGRPAGRASVRMLAPTGGVPRTTTADLDGRYEFTAVRAGDYRISAGKPGYVALEFGQRRAFEHGTIVAVRAGETLEKIDITLAAAGAISGRVFDENGDPLESVTVRLMQLRFGANRRQLLPVVDVGARVTNDQGAYRLYGVPPGQYIVLANVADQSRGQAVTIVPAGYVPTYYPGTPKPSEAQLITVGLSQDVSAIDMVLARLSTASVSGIVVDSQGQPSRPALVLATSQRSGGLAAEPFMKGANADGTFEFRNVPPGEWVLQAMGPASPQGEGEFASQFLTVNGRDVRDLRLQMSAGSRVEGRVVFEGGGDVAPSSVVVMAPPSDFDRAPLGGAGPGRFIQVRPDGTFTLDGLNGPRRIRLVRAPESWSLKAVIANGIDVTDTPVTFGTKEASLTGVEIILTKNTARVSGSVTDAGGHPVTDYTAIAFARDPDRWYQGSRFWKFTRPRQDGTFAIPDLPAGEYYVAAVDRMQGTEGFGEWQDPAFLNSIAPRATRVTLAEGQAVSMTPRLIVR